MSRKGVKPRMAWQDRFVFPTEAELLQPFHKQHVALIQLLRSRLLAFPEAASTIQWRGVPWRWCFVFTTDADREHPWAYLIPQPGKPLLAMPLPVDLLGELPVRKLSRPVRDAIAVATRVGGIAWPQWELTSRTHMEELLLIASLRNRADLLTTPAR